MLMPLAQQNMLVSGSERGIDSRRGAEYAEVGVRRLQRSTAAGGIGLISMSRASTASVCAEPSAFVLEPSAFVLEPSAFVPEPSAFAPEPSVFMLE